MDRNISRADTEKAALKIVAALVKELEVPISEAHAVVIDDERTAGGVLVPGLVYLDGEFDLLRAVSRLIEQGKILAPS